MTIVVKIDLDKEKFENFEAIAMREDCSGFFTMFCKYQKTWLSQYGKTRPRDKAQKFAEELQDEDMIKRLRIPVAEPEEWMMVLSGAKPPPGQPGETIELD